MYLKFKEKRLFVGMRLRDWSSVWYEPCGEADNDGTAPMGLFCSTSGMRTREPMEGEVAWLPCFDITTFTSRVKRERERMQQQFLYDSFRYLAEPSETEVLNLNKRLDQPGYTRWQTWFEVLKAEKRSRKRRRQNRTQTVLSCGLQLDEVEIDSDASDTEGLNERPPKRQKHSEPGSDQRGRKRGRGRQSSDPSTGNSGYDQNDGDDIFDGATPAPTSASTPTSTRARKDPNNRVETENIEDMISNLHRAHRGDADAH